MDDTTSFPTVTCYTSSDNFPETCQPNKVNFKYVVLVLAVFLLATTLVAVVAVSVVCLYTLAEALAAVISVLATS